MIWTVHERKTVLLDGDSVAMVEDLYFRHWIVLFVLEFAKLPFSLVSIFYVERQGGESGSVTSVGPGLQVMVWCGVLCARVGKRSLVDCLGYVSYAKLLFLLIVGRLTSC